ncbi:hypothetical protein DPMN_126896 [Dreissena polymorpha]|uniref:Uncharacterized protein n=1 Tax=Dreissena polymorpha TaxID=45954 RepID=A0A9D4JW08_DREPO|nr:hypothetical protein DPMN_126896 [Dreissena polymorpha]
MALCKQHKTRTACFMLFAAYQYMRFHEDLTINMTSRVKTRKTAPPPGGQYIIRTNALIENCPPPGGHFHETAAPPGGHVFQQTDIIGKNNLTTFHSSHIKKIAPPSGRHVFQRTRTIFELS